MDETTPLGPQLPTFHVGRRPRAKVITVTTRDASVLVDALVARSNPTAAAAAGKIAVATRPKSPAHLELGMGEDEEALAALARLRLDGAQLGRTLTRLETALRAKFAAEA